mgnify:CR=1 FL=1
MSFKPDLILFYGWSWIISKNLVENFKCLMLHPSPLPKYRGGSPIQNQIINGETLGAVSIFLMDDGIDTGPIVDQRKIPIYFDDTWSRVRKREVQATNDLLKTNIPKILTLRTTSSSN